jgi:hypothetical protein
VLELSVLRVTWSSQRRDVVGRPRAPTADRTKEISRPL